MARDWQDIAAAISRATLIPFRVASACTVSGGDINHAYQLDGTDGSCYFVKLNCAEHVAMFEAEYAALEAIAATNAVRVPHPVVHGISGQDTFLALEYLDLQPRGATRQLGEQLATMHLNHAQQFGWHINNTIGTTPQINTWCNDWIEFWRTRRLGFQLQLAGKNGYDGMLLEIGEQLLDLLPAFFAGYTPQPSLLHGDLWAGNHAYLIDGTPVIYDPASYYGDREIDLAMTELFGGFDEDFYAAYRANYPLDAGYATRRQLYNLYHILNHANLFGGSYARQAEQMMQRLLSEIR